MSLKTLGGLQAWLQPYASMTLDLHQLLSGGTWDVYGQQIRGGTRPTITSVYRSVAEQENLYDNRATNPYPVNRPGDSAHQWGLAFDSDVPDAQQPLYRQVREYVGWRVPSNDEVHAEVPSWRDLVRGAGYTLPLLLFVAYSATQAGL